MTMFKYLLVISFYFVVSNTFLEYGEFELKLTKSETIKGPKRKNCAEMKIKIVKDIYLDVDMNMKENMNVVKGTILGSMNGKQLLRLKIKNLCDHIFFRPLFQSLLNNSDHCAFEKGHLHMHFDVQSVLRNFFGGKFFFGDWKFTWIFHNEFCNLHSRIMYVSLNPKRLAFGDE